MPIKEPIVAHTHGTGDGTEPDRRDVLFLATGAMGAVGVAATVWPLIDQMNPSASERALSSIDVDVSAIEVGQQVTVTFLKSPVFIRRLTDEEKAAADATPVGDLKDQDAQNALHPGETATLEHRLVDPERDFLVMSGVCTHLGCVPVGEAGDFGGWFCPCHGSHYDTAGRIRKGPAPTNLPIPVASFTDEDTLKLG
jgi:ubiquinol-cytochrome c reductase iron-sulfur subunit